MILCCICLCISSLQEIFLNLFVLLFFSSLCLFSMYQFTWLYKSKKTSISPFSNLNIFILFRLLKNTLIYKLLDMFYFHSSSFFYELFFASFKKCLLSMKYEPCCIEPSRWKGHGGKF